MSLWEIAQEFNIAFSIPGYWKQLQTAKPIGQRTLWKISETTLLPAILTTAATSGHSASTVPLAVFTKP